MSAQIIVISSSRCRPAFQGDALGMPAAGFATNLDEHIPGSKKDKGVTWGKY